MDKADGSVVWICGVGVIAVRDEENVAEEEHMSQGTGNGGED